MSEQTLAEPLERLERGLRSLVLDVCESLKDDEFPQHLWTRVEREEGGRTSLPRELRPDVPSLMLSLFLAERHELPSFDRVFEAIQNDPSLSAALLVDAAGNPIRDEATQRNWTWSPFITGFLFKYFERTVSFAFDEESFDLLFKQFAEDVASDAITIFELSPLLNCELESAQLDLGPSLKLRQLSQDEIEEWVNHDSLFPGTPLRVHELLRLQCAIELSYQQGRYDSIGGRQDVIDKVSSLVTAIRLITDTDVSTAFTKRSSTAFNLVGGTSWSGSPGRLRGRPARIDGEGTQLVELWQRMQDNPNKSLVDLPLRRWNSGVERKGQDDELIDYWIALESLFVPDSSQEVRFRASLRIAAYLGQTPDEREKIYQQMRDSYDLRSIIVHGGGKRRRRQGRTTLDDLATTVPRTRSYLREALVAVLESDQPFEAEKMENQLLRK